MWQTMRPEPLLLALAACAPPPVDTSVPACPAWDDGTRAGEVEHSELVETSGLAPGTGGDLLWAHNDSGDAPRLFALGDDGRDQGTVALEGARARDWEDIARGPGPDDSWWLYVGDIGDNDAVRDTVAVFALPEPPPPGAGTSATATVTPRELVYEDGAHDAETLLVDPLSGDLYVLTKADDGRTGIYLADDDDTLRRVGGLRFGQGGLGAVPWLTGGDVSADGTRIVLRTYGGVHLWLRYPDEALHEALAGDPCRAPARLELQGEAIAFAPDRASYVTIGEGEHRAVWRFEER